MTGNWVTEKSIFLSESSLPSGVVAASRKSADARPPSSAFSSRLSAFRFRLLKLAHAMHFPKVAPPSHTSISVPVCAPYPSAYLDAASPSAAMSQTSGLFHRQNRLPLSRCWSSTKVVKYTTQHANTIHWVPGSRNMASTSSRIGPNQRDVLAAGVAPNKQPTSNSPSSPKMMATLSVPVRPPGDTLISEPGLFTACMAGMFRPFNSANQ